MRCGTGINRSWVPFCLTPIFDGPRWVRTFFGTCVTWVAPSEYVESWESKPNRCTVVQSSIRIRFFVWIRVAKCLRQWVVLRLVDTVQTSFKGRWLHFEAPGEGYWWSLMIFLSHPLIQHDPATSNPCDFLSCTLTSFYTSRQGAWTAGCIISLFHDLYIHPGTHCDLVEYFLWWGTGAK